MADEPNEKFKCPECGKLFDSKDSMAQHRKDAHQSAKHEGSKKPFNAKKLLPYVIGVIILVAVVSLAWWMITATTSGPGAISTFDLSSVPYQGNASAKLNIIEFGDYQCPICDQFFLNTEPQITQSYVDTGKAKFYFMDFDILGPDSATLSIGAWCANDQGMYYAYHDFMYNNQGAEGSGWASDGKVKVLAANITGLDTKKFDACLDNATYAARAAQLSQVAQSSGVTGTPSFFIGNPQIGYVSMVGALPFSNFQQNINAQLAKLP